MSTYTLGGDDDDIEYEADDAPLKYTLGHKVNSRASFKRRPIFAYDYLSLSKSNFCFNNRGLKRFDFRKYFTQVKYISTKSIEELFDSTGKNERFHHIKVSQKPVLQEELRRIFNIKGKFDYNNFPAIVQFALYTESDTVLRGGIKSFIGRSPRVICLIGDNGIFHVLLLDYDHAINKMNPH